jgi:hypothetical protein
MKVREARQSVLTQSEIPELGLFILQIYKKETEEIPGGNNSRCLE